MTIPCSEHRETLRLLSLKKLLDNGKLDEQERLEIEKEVARLEKVLGMD